LACGTWRFESAIDARLRLHLLPRSEHDVECDQQRDGGAGRNLSDGEAHGRDGDEHDVHRVAQLRERHRPHRRRLLALDGVRAVALQALGRLGGGEAGPGIGSERGDDLPGVPGIRRPLGRIGGLGRRHCVNGHRLRPSSPALRPPAVAEPEPT
jgi:hypothetical protein